MKFLELINKCLLELNYRQVNSFSELVKNDHKRIISILNVINKEICNIEGWNFLLRRQTLPLPAKQTELKNKINGRILYIFIDGEKYRYTEDFTPFLNGHAHSKSFSVFNDNILFPDFENNKNVDVIYYTRNSAVNSKGKEKEILENADDSSLIPEPFAEPLLVYGTCMRLKGNPQHIRFSYWMSMYKEALLNLKSGYSIYAGTSPCVRLYRN